MMRSLKAIFRKAVAPLVVAAPLLAGSAAYAQDTALNPEQPEALAVLAQETQTPSNDVIVPDAQRTSTAAPDTSQMSAFNVGPVTFVAPGVLFGLGSLPFIWVLLRSMPRKPKEEVLPTLRLLSDLNSEEQKPDNMPWWQKTMRMSVLSAAIIAMAGPTLNMSDDLSEDGPVVIVIDNDWSSAVDWSEASQELQYVIDQAENNDRQVFILTTAPETDADPLRLQGPISPDEARDYVSGITPHPWSVDREQALQSLQSADSLQDDNSPVYWLSNGLNDPHVQEFSDYLKTLGDLTILESSEDDVAYLLRAPDINGNEFAVNIQRQTADGPDTLTVSALDQGGNPLAEAEVAFDGSSLTGTGYFDLPLDVRNQIAKLSINGQNSAGASVLLDERFRSRPVGLIRDNNFGSVQALLDEATFVQSALEPYTEFREGALDNLLERPLSVLILTDNTNLSQAEEDQLEEWVQNGGTLLRFAGPNLASENNHNDELLPVELRSGTRTLGEGLGSSEPGQIAPFQAGSPFFSLETDTNIVIQRKIMAQPGLETEERTWASLTDGTPFVTAEEKGEGWVVLVHTTADTNWSNLPLSKLFIDMMRSVVSHSEGVLNSDGDFENTLSPVKIMDAFGQLGAAGNNVQTLSPEDIQNGTVDASTPPGLYGAGATRYAHNLSDSIESLDNQAGDITGGATVKQFDADAKQKDLKPALLGAAFLLAVADLLVLMKQQGFLNRRRRPARAPVLPGSEVKGPDLV